MTLHQEWQAFLRQHRLPLVTNIREELVDLLTSAIPVYVGNKNGTLIFSAVNEEKEHIHVQFQLIFSSLKVKMWKGNKLLLLSSTISNVIDYKDERISGNESTILRDFFRSWYVWCEAINEKGENKHDLRN